MRLSFRVLVTVASLFVCGGLAMATPFICSRSPPLLKRPPLHVEPKTQKLVDEFGRELRFNGANAVVKEAPWLPSTDEWSPTTSLVDKDFETLSSVGVNAIRLGTMWPGIQPQRGMFDKHYMEKLSSIVENAANYGIAVLLDMHQDLASEDFCGEGFPGWAVKVPKVNDTYAFPWPMYKPYKKDATGHPSRSECNKHGFGSYYFSEGVNAAFGSLYNNTDGIRDEWAAAWSFVGQFTRKLGAAVLGVELLNEPWAGDAFRDPLLMIPGRADLTNLQPMWDVGARAFWKSDNDHAVFFEPTVWSLDLNIPIPGWSGYSDVPLGCNNKSVFAFHWYAPPDFPNTTYMFDSAAEEISRLRCGGALTEFGVWPACGTNGCGVMHPSAVYEQCDYHGLSQFYWLMKSFALGPGPQSSTAYSLWNLDGTPNEAFRFNVSRTYAHIVAGRTSRGGQHFNVSSGEFSLSFVTVKEITMPITAIYFSQQYHYPHGIDVELSTFPAADANVTWRVASPGRLEVEHSLTGTPLGTRVTVHVVPKSRQ